MRTDSPRHEVRVRTPAGKLVTVDVQLIASLDLAERVADALAETLAMNEEELAFLAAPRFAFRLRDELEAAGEKLVCCVVEVVRRTHTRCGPRSRVVARYPVFAAV